jgi:DNA polymerase-3 subunit gamma/tau
MAYKALYRTYRPATFSEVAGQKHIVKTLQNALASQKVAMLTCSPDREAPAKPRWPN